MNEQNKKAAVDTGEKSIKARLFGDRKSGRAGGYTVLMTVVLLAALIVVNLIINALPTKFTKLDSSSSKMYTLEKTTQYISRA